MLNEKSLQETLFILIFIITKQTGEWLQPFDDCHNGKSFQTVALILASFVTHR